MNQKALKHSLLAVCVSTALVPAAVYAKSIDTAAVATGVHPLTVKAADQGAAPDKGVVPAKTITAATEAPEAGRTGAVTRSDSDQPKRNLSYAAQPQNVSSAETTEPGKQEGHIKRKATQLHQVVVTGNAGAKAVTQLGAAYEITVLNEDRLHDLDPHNTASILKTVPGVTVAASGGTAGNNVNVRGLPGGDSATTTTEVDGSPLYPLPNVGWTSTIDFFRPDDSVKRVEVVLGGPSVLFGTGVPGATFNFIMKNGMETPQGAGSIRATVGGPAPYNRLDVYWGGEVAPDWYVAVGGFGRKGDGVHRTQFPANLGGQWEGTLTRSFGDRGKLSFGVRHTRDKGLFITDSPLLKVNGKLKPFPGFDLRNDALAGNAVRWEYLPRGNGSGGTGALLGDLAKGRGINLTVYRSELDLHLSDGWVIDNHANYVTGELPITSLFNSSAPPQSVQSFINDAIASTNGNAALIGAAGGESTAGTAVFAHGGRPVSPDQLVLEANFETVYETVRSLTDELRVSKEFDNGNTLTVGAFLARFGYTKLEHSGNNLLLTLQNNADPISVRLNNGVFITSPNGFASVAAGGQDNNTWSGNTLAEYVSDTQVIGPWRIQAGVRRQHQEVVGYKSPVISGIDLDNNALTLYNNNANVLQFGAPKSKVSQKLSKTAWTVGVNRKLSDNASVFGRASNSFQFPGFNSIAVTHTGNKLIEEIRQYSVGVKAAGRMYSVALTAFKNKVNNTSFTGELQLSNGVFEEVTFSGAQEMKGVSLKGIFSPTQRLSMRLMVSYLNGNIIRGGTNNSDAGNTIPLPKWHYRFTPSYFVPTNWGALRLFATYEYVSWKYSRGANNAILPSYRNVSAGIDALVGQHWEFRLNGQNLTNEIGLTEGNNRALAGRNSGSIYGRSIYGRTWRFSVKYNF